MDLEALKIDRGTRQRRSSSNLGRFVPWVLLALLLFALWMFRGPLLARIDALRLPEVTVAKVEKSSAAAVGAVSGTASNGYIVAARRAALSADTPGRIVELNVTEGSTVKKGQIVARLYSEELEAALRQAEAELAASQTRVRSAEIDVAAARTDLVRLQKDVEAAQSGIEAERPMRDWYELETKRFASLALSNVSAQREADQARANLQASEARIKTAQAHLESAQAALENGRSAVKQSEAALVVAGAQIPVLEAARDLSKATLEKTAVRAPFDGIVVLKDAEVGEVVSPNSQGGTNARGSVVTMVDFASLEAQAEVPETSLKAVEIGRSANIYLDARPEKAYAGKVARIWPTANRSKGTIEVRVTFESPDEFLRPEMGVRVVFLGEQTTAQPVEAARPEILIGESALVKLDGKTGVFTLDRDVVGFRELVLGERRGGRVAVHSGLSEGEQIVLSPPTSLQSGDRVQKKEGP